MIIKLAQATCRIWPVYPPESLYVGLSALDFEAHRDLGLRPRLVYFGPSALFAAAQPPAGASLIIITPYFGKFDAELRSSPAAVSEPCERQSCLSPVAHKYERSPIKWMRETAKSRKLVRTFRTELSV